MKTAVLILMSVFVSVTSFASALVVKDSTNKTLTVKARMFYSGDALTEELAEGSTREIQRMWNAPEATVQYEGETYRVVFEVDYLIGRPNHLKFSEFCSYNYISIMNKQNPADRSYYEGLGSNKGVFYTSDGLGVSTTTAHEFGHGLYLDHDDGDQRDAEIPGIMFARGTLVKPQFQWNPNARAGEAGGTLNPKYRVVRAEDVQRIPFDQVTFDLNGVGCLWNGVPAKSSHQVGLKWFQIKQEVKKFFSF